MASPPVRHVPHRASRNVQVANVCPLWHFVSRRKSPREFPIADLHTIMQSTDFRTKSDMTRTPRCRFVRFALYTCRPVGRRRCGTNRTSRRRYVARIDTRRTQRIQPWRVERHDTIRTYGSEKHRARRNDSNMVSISEANRTRRYDACVAGRRTRRCATMRCVLGGG